VIVTADHGHVIDDGTVQRGQGEGDRAGRLSGRMVSASDLAQMGRCETAGGVRASPWNPAYGRAAASPSTRAGRA
jgi:glycine cleavage system aminomethyltransferase T